MADDADPLLVRLRALNARIESLVLQENPALEGEIERLDLEAAEIIRARCDARLRPITEAFSAAAATAQRLLEEEPHG